jgi:hypothetical protein
VVDNSMPAVTITGQPTALSTDSSPTFVFTTDEPGSSLFCRIDSNADVEFEPCGSPKTYAALDDGAHSFDVRAVDQAGNVGPIDEHDWTIDTLAPTATIDDKPSLLSAVDSASFTFHSDQAGGFQCRLDGDAPGGTGWTGCGSGTSGNKSYVGPDLDEGAHTFELRSQDAAGNVGPVALYEWVSDSVAPTVTIQTGPTGLSNQTAAEFTFSSNEPGVLTECRLDSGSFVACPTETSASYTVGQGAHTFSVRATDTAGHTSTTASRSWTVDSIPPAVDIEGGPNGIHNESTATFSFTAEPGASVACSLDGTNFTACSSPKTYSGLADGPYTVTVRAIDAAANSATDTRSWTIDTTAPQTTIGVGPPASTTSTDAEFEFEANEAATLQCSLDGAVFTTCTSPVAHSGLALGDHTFRVRAIDLAGNLDTSPALHGWRVVTEPPPAVPDSGVAGATKTKPRCKRKGKAKKRCKKKRRS